MTDLATFDQEAPAERKARRDRAKKRTSGARGSDYLTAAERDLLDTIRALGWDIQRAHRSVGVTR